MTKFFTKTFTLVFIAFLINTMNFSPFISLAFAQSSDEVPVETTIDSIIEEITGSQTEESMETETTLESMTEISTPNVNDVNLDYRNFIPFIFYNTYSYQGDGQFYQSQDTIMEFPPDNNGIFQVTTFTKEKAVSRVYQITSDGIFELAAFDNYDQVQDMRYSSQTAQGNKKMIFPSSFTMGKTYKTSVNGGYQRKIVEYLPELSIGSNQVFKDVIQIDEQHNDSSGNYTVSFYYASQVGLVYVEKVDSTGNISPCLQLITMQGRIN